MPFAPHYTLTLSCPDRIGIVARVAGFLAEHGGWIVEASHHADPVSKRFFLRQQIRTDSLPFDVETFRARFAALAQDFAMQWSITDSRLRKRVVILVSQQGHCLYDLLGRWRTGELAIDIPAVISNHETFREFVEWHGIPYHYLPVTSTNKREAFAAIADLFDEVRGDVMVLARYMQILDAEMCARYRGRIINIHHSFLPGFVGTKPYHQAYARGVKLVGATCHYVTEELDQGPIIEQDVLRVDHGDTPEELIRSGRDVEKTVLARGLRYHLEDRVLLNGQRTVVFR
ncbi:formyltetrahydrofolate deformylase [Acidithiobacillus sp. AMEEHan]|uniref:formyltetrahydrofolate deformylase n=1 Tax=Acidithiobacillus sp. AMEEHan TaxID=2994951 RepID=UPI0027E5606C|nr:formyltetrahydrofolate deformylase [Acidithiobacillus sp. AMEEHan]